jgi:hypothetical protein
LRLQGGADDPFEVSRKLPGRHDLADEREGEGSVREDPDSTLQPLVAPYGNHDLIARIDPVSRPRNRLGRDRPRLRRDRTRLGECGLKEQGLDQQPGQKGNKGSTHSRSFRR